MMDPCALLLEDYATKGYVAPERQPQADYGEEERAFHQPIEQRLRKIIMTGSGS